MFTIHVAVSGDNKFLLFEVFANISITSTGWLDLNETKLWTDNVTNAMIQPHQNLIPKNMLMSLANSCVGRIAIENALICYIPYNMIDDLNVTHLNLAYEPDKMNDVYSTFATPLNEFRSAFQMNIESQLDSD
jgi:hypothetical protein